MDHGSRMRLTFFSEPFPFHPKDGPRWLALSSTVWIVKWMRTWNGCGKERSGNVSLTWILTMFGRFHGRKFIHA